MNNWYTRQEVADLLGVSKGTVYLYSKQGKIVKIEDPLHLIREARYERKEVDELAEIRRQNKPLGLRPSELAKQLNVAVSKIYSIIRENNLPVDEFPVGDRMNGYSISEDMAKIIKKEIEKTTSTRGTRFSFFDSNNAIALYQRYHLPNGQVIRAVKNDENEWGFYLQSNIWITLDEARTTYKAEAAYPLHKPNEIARGYTDFKLSKSKPESFDFLDFAYSNWGIENIRLRETDSSMFLSIKSGDRDKPLKTISTLTEEMIETFLVSGSIVHENDKIILVSGNRKTSLDLPIELLTKVQALAKDNNMKMNEFIEETLRERLEREDHNGYNN